MHRIETVIGSGTTDTRRRIRIRIITDRLPEAYTNDFDARESDEDISKMYHDTSMYPNFISVDDSEIFVFLDVDLTKKYVSSDQQIGFWVSERRYISRMMKLFEKLWSGQTVQEVSSAKGLVKQLKPN